MCTTLNDFMHFCQKNKNRMPQLLQHTTAHHSTLHHTTPHHTTTHHTPHHVYKYMYSPIYLACRIAQLVWALREQLLRSVAVAYAVSVAFLAIGCLSSLCIVTLILRDYTVCSVRAGYKSCSYIEIYIYIYKLIPPWW